MDIDLLAKMVKEVVMDHDSVTLPGLGCFVAELVPATFADRGYTILPPYRRLYFSPKQGDDKLLVELYAKSNDVPEADAARILEDFLLEMKEVLKQRKTLVLSGLGRLRATRENHFFFVADEDLDIYPSGYGLQPVSLKTHEETPEEVAAAVSNLADILESDPAPVASVDTESENTEAANDSIVAEEKADAPLESLPASEEPVSREPAPSEEVTSEGASSLISATEEVTSSEEEAQPKKSGWKVVGRVLLVLLGLVLLAAVALAVVGRVAPQWLDRFLYSPEELDILLK